MFECKNRLNQSYGSKDVKVLRLWFKLEIKKLRQGLICNFRKLNRDLIEKIKTKNVNIESQRDFV
jgi:hypothetical protein